MFQIKRRNNILTNIISYFKKTENNVNNDEFVLSDIKNKIHDFVKNGLLSKTRNIDTISVFFIYANNIDSIESANIHFKSLGFLKSKISNTYVPYHFIVLKNGNIIQARDLSDAPGIENNKSDIAIGCISNVDEFGNRDLYRTESQTSSLNKLIKLITNNGINILKIINETS